MNSKALRLGAALLATAALLSACDDDDADPTGPSEDASVRVVHASPDAPNIDVLIDNQIALSNLVYRTASQYTGTASGARNVKVRATGTTTVVIDANQNIVTGGAYTILATGRLANIQPLVLTDDNTAPTAGNAKLRVVHAAPSAPAVDVYVTAPGASITNATPAVSNLSFRNASSYANVTAGTYQVRVTPAGSKTVAIDAGNITVATGQIRSAIALDAVNGGTPFSVIMLEDRNP